MPVHLQGRGGISRGVERNTGTNSGSLCICKFACAPGTGAVPTPAYTWWPMPVTTARGGLGRRYRYMAGATNANRHGSGHAAHRANCVLPRLPMAPPQVPAHTPTRAPAPPHQPAFPDAKLRYGTQWCMEGHVPMPALMSLVAHLQVKRRKVRPRREGGLGLSQKLLDALCGGRQPRQGDNVCERDRAACEGSECAARRRVGSPDHLAPAPFNSGSIKYTMRSHIT